MVSPLCFQYFNRHLQDTPWWRCSAACRGPSSSVSLALSLTPPRMLRLLNEPLSMEPICQMLLLIPFLVFEEAAHFLPRQSSLFSSHLLNNCWLLLFLQALQERSLPLGSLVGCPCASRGFVLAARGSSGVMDLSHRGAQHGLANPWVFPTVGRSAATVETLTFWPEMDPLSLTQWWGPWPRLSTSKF